jgi:hypothetical protein
MRAGRILGVDGRTRSLRDRAQAARLDDVAEAHGQSLDLIAARRLGRLVVGAAERLEMVPEEHVERLEELWQQLERLDVRPHERRSAGVLLKRPSTDIDDKRRDDGVGNPRYRATRDSDELHCRRCAE